MQNDMVYYLCIVRADHVYSNSSNSRYHAPPTYILMFTPPASLQSAALCISTVEDRLEGLLLPCPE